MSNIDALVLIRNKLGKYSDSDDATELVTALEFIPLAIVQAATYIMQRKPPYSIRKYLQDFRKSDRERTRLLNYEGGNLRRDKEAKNAIFITWQISFDHIREIRPSATNLLSLMSFFNGQGIPNALLQSRTGQEISQQDQKESNNRSFIRLAFDEDISVLRDFSFISNNADGTVFQIHRLVQLAIRKWLEAHGEQEVWKRQFIKNLYTELPTGEYENWAWCQTLLPHVQLAAAQQPEDEDLLKDWASILYNAAWYAWSIGNGVEAQKMSLQAMKVRERILSPDDDDTLNVIAMVGLAYKLKGLWDVAEELEVQVLETRKKKLGADHPSTLTSMDNLASTYMNQGRWKEAEELEVQVVETSLRVLGAEHPDTISAMSNLASTHRDQGRLDEATKMFKKVVEQRRRILGEEHPDAISAMNNLASTYRDQGRLDEATKMFKEVVEQRRRILGEEHPDTISAMGNLATTLGDQGELDEAITLLEVTTENDAGLWP